MTKLTNGYLSKWFPVFSTRHSRAIRYTLKSLPYSCRRYPANDGDERWRHCCTQEWQAVFFMFLLILFFRFFIFCENFVQHFRNLYNRKKNKWQLIFENENENYIINPINPFGECDKNCQFGLIVKERKCTSLLFLFFPHSSQGSCVTCPFHVNHLAWVSIF